jgi:hypothetical protein
MDIEKNRRQCMKCKRLPRSAAEEAEAEDLGKPWIDPQQMSKPCDQQLLNKKS